MEFDLVKYKKQALNMINKNDIDIQRIMRSNRDLIYCYTCKDSSTPLEMVISNEELKAL